MADAATDAATATRDGQTALALRLAKHLAPPAPGAEDSAAAAIATNKNVAFSPVSLHAALALTAAGAAARLLGAPSAEGLADFGRRVADRVLADRSDAGGLRVLFGGGVWVDAACRSQTRSATSQPRPTSRRREP